MSSSPVIPKEKLSAYQRWELHAFDAPESPASASAGKADAENVTHTHQHAYESGRADGLREGARKAAAEAQQLIQLLAAIEKQNAEINQHIAQGVLELSLELARQMVRQALNVHPEIILPLIHDALSRAAQPVTAASIALHPADAALVREQLGAELGAAGWRIVEDPNLARGGAMLQTAATKIDATAGTRWHSLAAALGQNSEWMA